MAIAHTNLNGTDSVSSARITLNTNFQTIVEALNKVLQMVDIATGKINNYGFGTNNDIETEDLIVRGSTGGGINVVTGGILIGNGGIQLSGAVEFGAGSNVKLEKIVKNFQSGPGNIGTINASGTGGTGGTGPVGCFVLPRLDTTTINDIKFPAIASMVYDMSVGPTGVMKICVASGLTGTWKTVTLT